VSAERYMLAMLKHLSARGNLFLLVRTHHHLAYYFNLNDTRSAANQNGVLSLSTSSPTRANVVELHPISQVVSSRGQ
jgi:hypothetical protein